MAPRGRNCGTAAFGTERQKSMSALMSTIEGEPDSLCSPQTFPSLTRCRRRLSNFIALRASSFDHLVGAHEERLRNGEANRLGGGQVDDEFKFCRLLDRDIGGLRSTEDLVDQLGSAAEQIGYVGSIRYKTSRFDVLALHVDRRQSRARRQCIDAGSVGGQKGAGSYVDGVDAAHEALERGPDILNSPDGKRRRSEAE